MGMKTVNAKIGRTQTDRQMLFRVFFHRDVTPIMSRYSLTQSRVTVNGIITSLPSLQATSHA